MLFGSVARSDDTEDSDIDILIVSPIANEIRHDISVEVMKTLISKEEIISPIIMTSEHFNNTKNYSFLRNVLDEGIVLD